jgi:hypothetical protein
MAKRSNSFREHLDELLNVISALNLEAQVASKQLEQVAERKASALSETDVEYPGRTRVVSSSAVLLGIDPFSDDPQFVSYTMSGVQDESWVNLVTETAGRIRAQCFATSYEAMERFMKKAAAIYFFVKRNETQHRRNDFRSYLHKSGKKVGMGTPQYYEAYVEWMTKRNCNELLCELRKRIPAVDERSSRYAGGSSDLLRLWTFCGACRHAIVHHHGVVQPKELKKLHPDIRKWVKGSVQPEVFTKIDTFLPSVDQTKDMLRAIADLGYLLYRTLSHSCDMEIDFVPQ